MGYFINKIPNNLYNKYKYQYIDHIEATIDLRQNYWDFFVQLIMINNYSLPLNTLLVNLSIPFQEIKGLTFNLSSDQSQASKLVEHNHKYAKIYESKFNIDISNNQYLKQDLNNVLLNSKLSFDIDTEVIIKSKASISQEDLDGLILETQEQKWDYKLYYTNTHIINCSEQLTNTYGYSITKNGTLAKYRLIDCYLNNYSINDNSIIDLFYLVSPTLFKIEQAKVKFYYWIDLDLTQHTLEIELEFDKSYVYETTLKFDKSTSFDFSKNEVVIDQGGVKGFYLPKKAQGYYELELKLAQDTDTVKIKVKNDFCFNQLLNKPRIDICKNIIKSINKWEVIKW